MRNKSQIRKSPNQSARLVQLLALVAFVLLATGCKTVSKGSSGGEPRANSSWNEEQKSIKNILERFTKAVDERNIPEAKATQHPQIKHFVVLMSRPNNLMTLPKSKYMMLLKKKIIGGAKRSLKIHWIAVNGPIASAKVTMKSKKHSFEHFASFLKIKGKWNLVSFATVVK